MIQLDTTNGHNQVVIDKFNAISKRFSDDLLLQIILVYFCDDEEINGIADELEELIYENKPTDEEVNLCKCNRCDLVMLDKNPQINAPTYKVNLFKIEDMQYLKDNGGDYFWACPTCESDEYLTDEISEKDLVDKK